MNNIEIGLRQPWLLLLAVPALAAVILAWRRLPGNRKATWTQKLPLWLRCICVALAATMLAGLFTVTNRAEVAMVALVDRSDSMSEQARLAADAAVAELTAASTGSASLAVVNFAAESALARDWSGQTPSAGTLPAGDATDIASAIRAAMALLPRDSQKRVALLTDGAFTDGVPMALAQSLHDKGIRLDATLLASEPAGAEALISQVTLPADTALGQPMQLGVTVMCTGSYGATLRVSDTEGKLSDRQVRLFEGENIFTLTAAPRVPGLQEITVELIMPEDTCPDNNRYGAVTNVVTAEGVLLVEGHGEDGRALQSLLEKAGVTVSRVSVESMPQTIAEMCAYGMIVLMNVNLSDVPDAVPARLADYVTVYGRSLLTSGGEDTYIFGHFRESPLEAMLPVEVEVTRTESLEPAALLLLIDNSASMEGTAITMAKRGAIKALESLQENDYAGVITFSTEHSVLAPLMSMVRREQIITDLAGLGTVMGTQYTGALLEAERQMNLFDKPAHKHIILVSDGNPSDTSYEPIIQRMAEQGVTITTIAVGTHVSEEIMQGIADMGGGRCYMVESSYDLPSILLTDTALMQVDYLAEEAVTPVAGNRRYTLPSGIPQLAGYVRTQARPDADTPLITADGTPIFAQRQSGAGMAACFASDLSGRWSAEWLQNPQTVPLLTDLITGLLPASHGSAAVSASLRSHGLTADLQVTWADAAAGDTLTAYVTPPMGDPLQVTLERGEDGVYTHEIPRQGNGRYHLRLTRHAADGTELAAVDTAAVSSYSSEYDLLRDIGERQRLLADMCAVTGGELFDEARQMTLVSLDNLYVEKDLTLPLAWITLVCLLAEAVLRKLRFHRRARARN